MLNPDMVFLVTCKSRAVLASVIFISVFKFSLDPIVAFDVFVGRSSVLAISWMDGVLWIEGRDPAVPSSVAQICADCACSKIAHVNSGKPE